MNSSYILFFTMTIISTMITLSSNNWMGMWMGLEMNLMAFIPFISKSKNMKSSQSMMIYFLTQSIGSIILLFSILMSTFIMTSPLLINELTKNMLIISILIKMGAAPFHMWFPEMMSKLNWKECCLLTTWQKLAPMTVLSNIINPNWIIYMSIMLSTMMGAIGGLNQTSLRKIMAYSSINHMGWMIALISVKFMWYKYLIIYTMIVSMMMMYFNYNNMYFINQLISSSISLTEKYTYIMLMMSMGGLPPFLGFLPKLMTIQMMIETNLIFILMIMVMSSLITLFYYLRLMSSMILSYSSMNKWMMMTPTNKFIIYTMNIMNMALPMIAMLNFM
uniref:NADH-ubiquinone oxidoreductase chain 2 n=1 Tax=Sadoletus valdezi TaxID=2813444 RepID=A0A8T9ZX95_9HEMI|nr:NADH dehydrogenase subunit 2 [Sadoletus valdezi]